MAAAAAPAAACLYQAFQVDTKGLEPPVAKINEKIKIKIKMKNEK